MQPNQFNENKTRKIKPALISLIALIVVTVIGAIVYATTRNKDKNTAVVDTGSTKTTPATQKATKTPTPSTSKKSTAKATTAKPKTVYKDGTYTATGDYNTPGGTESVTVNLTLKGDKVTTVKTVGSATGGNSAQFQGQFLSAYQSEVVGKAINNIQLTRVAGSSLTPNGFNAAIDKIKADAKS
ncbi:MAG: hypothetical protein QM613_02285 [Micrococcaceae bacterium]